MAEKKQGTKFDAGKPMLSLIPYSALTEEARVLMFGMEKYGRDNWRQGFEWTRLIDAGMRHLQAFNEGEELDPESGLSHLAHARCCLAFLIEFEKTHPELDNRHKQVPVDQKQTVAFLKKRYGKQT